MKLNDVGYPVISENLFKKVFGVETKRSGAPSSKLRNTQRNLERLNIPFPVDYPEGLFDGDLPFPSLGEGNLEVQFEKMALDFVGEYLSQANKLANCKIPRIPTFGEFVIQSGWTKYTYSDTGQLITEKVPYPLESGVFDTETFVNKGSFPVIGTALTDKAAYIWLAEEMVNPDTPEDQWDQYGLIPLGTEKFIIGHNIAYDRVRTQEAYSLQSNLPENFYFDTLSAHIAVSGLASGQRWLYVLAAKDPESLTEEERRKLRYSPRWASEGSTNSLLETYNFHVAAVKEFFSEGDFRLKDSDKAIRNLFVDAESIYELADPDTRDLLLDYAIKDVFYTFELYQALWPKYRNSTPSDVALAGHYFLSGSRIPVVKNWSEWISNTEEVFNTTLEEMDVICKGLMKTYLEEWGQELDKDLRLITEKFEQDPQTLIEEAELQKKKTVKLLDVLKAFDKLGVQWRFNSESWANKDPWLKQLDWNPRNYTGKFAFLPNWASQFVVNGDKNKFTVKNRASHLLLKLTWNKSPIIWVDGRGWCYEDSEEGIKKIPHPSGKDENVGGLFSKEFVVDMEVDRLSSDLPAAKQALNIAVSTSFWLSIRKRVMDRIFVPTPNPYGEDCNLVVPSILPHGTVTRRTVEPMMVTMCSTKPNRIGTELKTRLEAPEGWKIVGADFDGQELQIASTYADMWEGGYIGASPMTYIILAGSKEKGTDAHTLLSKKIETDRDTAKGVGFAMLYGAGSLTIANTIKKKYKDRKDSELRKFGDQALTFKKGVKNSDGVYVGGTDSGCYNYMESIALRSRIPTLPCLKTKISTALRPSVVGSQFATGRINWTIQSSGAEVLSIFLTSVHWFCKKFKIPAQFIISIHDEMWFMVPEKYVELFSVVFQMAHLYTWARFHFGVGICDLPLSRAFFSSVAIDNRIRKTPTECTKTPSNPFGDLEPPGSEYSMKEMFELGWVKKLSTRADLIERGLI